MRQWSRRMWWRCRGEANCESQMKRRLGIGVIRFVGPAMSLAALGVFAACSSFERFTDRQNRHHRYARILRTLPERLTRAELYAALPSQTKSPPPSFVSVTGIGVLGTERYALDADFQVVAPFLYAMPQLAISDLFGVSPSPKLSTPIVQSPRDSVFGAELSIESRHNRSPLLQ